MAHSEIISDLMAKLRHSRNVQRKRSSKAPLKSILTKSSSCVTHKTTAPGFLRYYPALMDPRNFLQLITRYTTADVLLWANNGRKLPIVSAKNINQLCKRAIRLMGERTPGGEDMLTKIIDIAKSHNRLDLPKRKLGHMRSEFVFMNIDAWYGCVSQSATLDFKLPLHCTDITEIRDAMILLLGNDGTQRMSLILSELLHDPLFPYRRLQDIPDHVLLEWCSFHRYPHVLDKLKVNNPCTSTTQENIKIRVESLMYPPALWAPEDFVESIAEDDTKSIDSNSSLFMEDDDMGDAASQGSESVDEYFQRCGCCLDAGVEHCEVTSGLRQPGQICTRCEALGEFCEDRSPGEFDGSLTQEAFERSYLQRQKFDGHIRERAAENDKRRVDQEGFTLRAQLYLLLLDEASGWHESSANASMLCLPNRKPDEGKILSLVERISEPDNTADLAKKQAKKQSTLLSASTADKESIPVDVNAAQSNEDDDMEDDDDEESVMIACNLLAERW